MSRMHYVVARLERKRDLRHIDAAPFARSHGTLRVRKGDESHLCRREDHAKGDIHIDDVDLTSFELRRRIPYYVKDLVDRNSQINQGKLHFLTSTEMRYRENHRKAHLGQRAQSAKEFLRIARHINALHYQLAIELHAHTHDRNVGCTRIRAEIEFIGTHVQIRYGNRSAYTAL